MLEPINYNGNNFEEKMKDCFTYFNDIFMNKDNRPEYNGRFIFFNTNRETTYGERKVTLNYPEKFIHLISIDDADEQDDVFDGTQKYNIFPCYNDVAYETCNSKCTASEIPSFYMTGRSECYYRMNRVHWIREIIDLANKDDQSITEWREPKTTKKGSQYDRVIRYQDPRSDYLIVLKEDKNKLIFITAHPVVLKAKKKKLDSDYKKFK